MNEEKKRPITYQELRDHGKVIASEWSSDNAFSASITIEMPDGEQYKIDAWGNDNDADAESEDDVDFDTYEGDSPWVDVEWHAMHSGLTLCDVSTDTVVPWEV